MAINTQAIAVQMISSRKQWWKAAWMV